MRFLRKSLLLALLLLAFSAAEAADVAKIRAVVKSVLVSRPGEMTKFVGARLNQGLVADQHLRTLKRSQAMLRFDDGAQLKVNERTELIIQTSASMKRLKLGKGAVWLKVAKGQSTTVETPTVTAAVRGTEFEVTSAGEVRVYEGSVEVTVISSGQTFLVEAGKMFDPSRQAVVPIPPGAMPVSYGGGTPRWWEGIIEGREILTADDGDAYELAANSAFPGRFQAPKGAGVAGPARTDPFVNRLDVRSDFAAWPTILGGAGFLLSQPRLDQSTGLALELGASWSQPSFGYGGVSYEASGTRTSLAGEAIAKLPFENRNRVAVQLARRTEFNFRPSENLTFFGGHMSIPRTQIPVDSLSASLTPDQYSAAGVAVTGETWSLAGGWIHDIDPLTSGSQQATFANASYYVLGGKLNFSARNDRGKTHAGAGVSLPALPGRLDVYGQVSSARDLAGTSSTVGLYLPGLYEAADVDIFLEYQSRPRLGTGWAVLASRRVTEELSITGHWQWVNSRQTCGLGLSLRF